MAAHSIVQIELSSLDHHASGKFYSELFGWEINYEPEVNYATFSTGEGVSGGFMPVSAQSPAGLVVVYVDTDDIPASLAKAEALGGKIVVTKTEIPGRGWFGIFSDLTGNLVGLYTPLMK